MRARVIFVSGHVEEFDDIRTWHLDMAAGGRVFAVVDFTVKDQIIRIAPEHVASAIVFTGSDDAHHP